jgi:hypothetical protein
MTVMLFGVAVEQHLSVTKLVFSRCAGVFGIERCARLFPKDDDNSPDVVDDAISDAA